jgi:hypothetical protein
MYETDTKSIDENAELHQNPLRSVLVSRFYLKTILQKVLAGI